MSTTLLKLVVGEGIEPSSNGYQPFVLTYCTNLVLNRWEIQLNKSQAQSPFHL